MASRRGWIGWSRPAAPPDGAPTPAPPPPGCAAAAWRACPSGPVMCPSDISTSNPSCEPTAFRAHAPRSIRQGGPRPSNAGGYLGAASFGHLFEGPRHHNSSMAARTRMFQQNLDFMSAITTIVDTRADTHGACCGLMPHPAHPATAFPAVGPNARGTRVLRCASPGAACRPRRLRHATRRMPRNRQSVPSRLAGVAEPAPPGLHSARSPAGAALSRTPSAGFAAQIS